MKLADGDLFGLRFSQSERVAFTDWDGIVRTLDADEIRTCIVEAAKNGLLLAEASHKDVSYVPCLNSTWKTDIARYKAIIAAFEEEA